MSFRKISVKLETIGLEAFSQRTEHDSAETPAERILDDVVDALERPRSGLAPVAGEIREGKATSMRAEQCSSRKNPCAYCGAPGADCQAYYDLPVVETMNFTLCQSCMNDLREQINCCAKAPEPYSGCLLEHR